MPGLATDSGGGGTSNSISSALVTFLSDYEVAVVCPLRHGLKPPISRDIYLLGSRQHPAHLSFRPPPFESDLDDDVEEKVMELKLLNWQERPLLYVSHTNLLLSKLQELSMTRLCPDFVEADLPPHALSSVRLALATNLGRAIREES
ncbi:hypothetical protein GH714_043651 [Hevea brasiliensis]|uniref:Uncharacterized protein n=1 Tax=Hevea brasiliensis TaxID=3981 RepID=A0A6A6K3K8_HEVBR|nr:hypothetical protein GH714_043651 [Hevea brasiliensis]